MKHEEIKQKLFALYDGPLSEKERVLVEDHLPSCPECQMAVEDSRQIAGVLFSSPSFSEASEDLFVSKVTARINLEKQPQASPSRWNTLQWLLPLGGSAVAAAWVFFSVLPGTPGLSAGTAAENYFADSDASLSSSQLVVIPASTTEELVVALIK